MQIYKKLADTFTLDPQAKHYETIHTIDSAAGIIQQNRALLIFGDCAQMQTLQ